MFSVRISFAGLLVGWFDTGAKERRSDWCDFFLMNELDFFFFLFLFLFFGSAHQGSNPHHISN